MILLKTMQQRPSGTFFMQTLMYTAEDWLLNSQNMEWSVLKNCNHIVQTWLSQPKVYMTEPFNKYIKEGGFAINYIKIFKNANALPVSVGNSYSEDQLIHTFLDNFHQCGNIQLK